ncbi:hypothetical protein GPA10_31590 [Streptomyces sp. p1417]|uniref:Uncharacterized protein n=1 Tax=Streptomyces typhae TaxID=2681492 RepID=A0A6L6X636_9ACTN|nr:hypothetical protein [Streptomyces typhae]MVO89177.1 hypothetical protein [Streptomyces typhae]
MRAGAGASAGLLSECSEVTRRPSSNSRPGTQLVVEWPDEGVHREGGGLTAERRVFRERLRLETGEMFAPLRRAAPRHHGGGRGHRYQPSAHDWRPLPTASWPAEKTDEMLGVGAISPERWSRVTDIMWRHEMDGTPLRRPGVHSGVTPGPSV